MGQLPKLRGLFPSGSQGSVVPRNEQLYLKGLPLEHMIIIDLYIWDSSFTACEEGVFVSSSHKPFVLVAGCTPSVILALASLVPAAHGRSPCGHLQPHTQVLLSPRKGSFLTMIRKVMGRILSGLAGVSQLSLKHRL